MLLVTRAPMARDRSSSCTPGQGCPRQQRQGPSGQEHRPCHAPVIFLIIFLISTLYEPFSSGLSPRKSCRRMAPSPLLFCPCRPRRSASAGSATGCGAQCRGASAGRRAEWNPPRNSGPPADPGPQRHNAKTTRQSRGTMLTGTPEKTSDERWRI